VQGVIDRLDVRRAAAAAQGCGDRAHEADDRLADIGQRPRQSRLHIAGSGIPLARPIITTSWRSRRIVRSNGPVSGPLDRCAERSRSASAPVALQAGYRGADAVLNPVQGVVVEAARQPRPAIRRRQRRAVPRACPLLTRIWLTARDGSTTNDTSRPVSAPTVTSRTPIES